MKVLWLTNVPSPYRVDFFNELGKLCDLTVLFQKRTSNERDESWKKYEFNNFRGVFLKGISINTDSAICLSVSKYISRKKYDKIVISSHSSPTGILALLKLKRKKIPYFLEVDGGFSKSGKGLKEKFKHFLISGASAYFSTGEETDKYLIAYGAEKEKIIRYPFTSLKNDDLDRAFFIAKQDKDFIRKKLGIKEDSVILSTYGFHNQKSYKDYFDLLTRTCESLDKNIGVYVIGDKPAYGFDNVKTTLGLSNLHFVKPESEKELAHYYGSADLFLLLHNGNVEKTVINEAMSYGLPIVKTFNCVACTEMVYEQNGVLVDTDNQRQIGETLADLINDSDKLSNLAKRSIRKINAYNVKNYEVPHFKVFAGGWRLNKILSKDRLSIGTDFVILSIGQFIHRKGFDVLLESIAGIKNVKLFVIGGSPTKEYLNIVEKYGLTNVTFLPFMNKEKLDLYFKAADLFVLPTREDIWGLVINEAMAYGLPVITTNRCIAGLELIKYDNGFLIDIDDKNALTVAIKSMISYYEKYESILISNYKISQEYTIEKMASSHIKVFSFNETGGEKRG